MLGFKIPMTRGLSNCALAALVAWVLSACAPAPMHQMHSSTSSMTAPQSRMEEAAAAEEAENVEAADNETGLKYRFGLSDAPKAAEAEASEDGSTCGDTEGISKADQARLDQALEYCKTSQDLWAQGHLDKSMKALDQAYEMILEVAPEDDPELSRQKEDLRFMIAKRILEIHASRYTTVQGPHRAIPLTMNKYVEEEIHRFLGPERAFFIDAYRRSGLYRPAIVKALKEAGLPKELSWLPLIESGYKVTALSRARALGLWQFIPSTGYKFGLDRDVWVDERMDPQESTAAAIAYLKELHQIFGDWSTVLAAYNCGEGTVLRVIRNQQVNYLDHFWDLYGRLPSETARYVPRFLATLAIVNNPQKYGIDLGPVETPPAYEKVTIKKQVRLKTIAEALGVPDGELTELNPELRHQATPPTPYALKVPTGKGEILLAKMDDLSEWQPSSTRYVYHRVRRGESLSSIAQRYGADVENIARVNRLNRRRFIRAGEKLKIPVAGSVAVASAKGSTCSPASTYVVRNGDSLWGISKKFNMSPTQLRRLNGLRSNALQVGQVLKVNGVANDEHEARSYKVQPGDNLSSIAASHAMTLSTLMEINDLNRDSVILPGQDLVVR